MSTKKDDNDKEPLPPNATQPYPLIHKERLSHNSFLLRYQIPPQAQRPHLGTDPRLPTCVKVDYADGQDAKTLQPKTLSKSYSPVSHPNAVGVFDLIVKGYEPRPGGGVGQYLCDMEVGEEIQATLKAPRVMHGSSEVVGRNWTHVGLIAGGTGIAPLLQIARILLEEENDDNGNNVDTSAAESKQEGENAKEQEIPTDPAVVVHLLFVNRHKDDILGRSEIEAMAARHPGQFRVSYALTGDDHEGHGPAEDGDSTIVFQDDDNDDKNAVTDNDDFATPRFFRGRGTVATARATLPSPDHGNRVMIFVCGKDGFVEHWAGPVARGPPKPGGKKGPKIQGPLLGVLQEAGFTANQVFKY